jgi:hypothetical protein
MGGSNSASLGISESVGRINTPYVLDSGRANSRITTAAFTWRHAEDWTLSLDWQRAEGGRSQGVRRLAQLAAGAPLSASGLSLTLASVPMALGARSTVTFGGLVSNDRLQQHDRVTLDLESPERTAGRLFMRVGF